MLCAEMAMLDLLFRFAALGVLLVLCVHFAKERRGGWLGLFGALFAVSVAGYLAVSSPFIRPALGWLFHPLVFAAVASPLLFYLFSRALFDDGFEPAPWHGAALLVLELAVFLRIGGVAAPDEPPAIALFALDRLIGLGFTVAALVQALAGRMGDLIEGRRRFRLVFVGVLGAYVILVLSLEIAFSGGGGPLWLDVLNAGAILAISAVIALYILAIRPELLIATPAPAIAETTARASPTEVPPPTTAPRPRLDPADRRLIEALRRSMESERLYRQEGLTIAALARRLGTQEHRLRRLINQELGYRNFAAFLNEHRIAEVRAALGDPDKAHLPILTIAMDAGYRSLGPFNQAFKRATGLTPSEFRRNARPDAPLAP